MALGVSQRQQTQRGSFSPFTALRFYNTLQGLDTTLPSLGLSNAPGAGFGLLPYGAMSVIAPILGVGAGIYEQSQALNLFGMNHGDLFKTLGKSIGDINFGRAFKNIFG